MSWQFLFTFKNLLQFSLMCDILRWSCNIIRHRATSSYILLCLDLIYTNINAKGHATMILSNIRMCMQFAKNVQFISCCNLTYAYVMRLSWVSHASGGKHFNIAILHDVHAILCKFHKIPLRLPYVLCSCPAITTRSIRIPHDSLRFLLYLADLHKKMRTPACIFHMDSADDTKMTKLLYLCLWGRKYIHIITT